MKATTKTEMRKEIERRWLVGARMANILFNLSQSARMFPAERNGFARLVRAWDGIGRAEPKR